MNKKKHFMKIGVLDSWASGMGISLGDANIQKTPFILTSITTGSQTLTLQGMTVATGKTVVADWGDGNTDTYTSGSGTRTHAYAGAGTWTVKLANRGNITLLDLQDSKISATISTTNPLPVGLTYLDYGNPTIIYNANTSPLPTGLTHLRISGQSGFTYNANTNPLPSGLTTLTLVSLAGLTYNANTNPLPSGLTSLTLSNLTGFTYNANINPLPAGLTFLNLTVLAGLTYNANTNPLPVGLTSVTLYTLAGLTWEINASQPYPIGVTTVVVVASNSVTCTAWTDNAIQSIRWESSLNAAAVDNVLNQIWLNKANFTYATPLLDLLGGSNAAPNGVYQAASPPTTGNEKKYDLVNGNYTPTGPEWTVQTA